VRAGPSIATVVLAGGSGTRLGLPAGANKVFLPLGGRPLLAWSLRALYDAVGAGPSVLVARAGDEQECRHAAESAGVPPPRVVVGGATRTASEAAGIEALAPEIEAGEVDVVLVHDGARPFPDAALVDRVTRAAWDHGAAVPGTTVADGLVRRGDGLLQPVPSASIRAVQTPQGFGAGVLLEAVRRAGTAGADAADTASLVAAFGGPTAVLVAGSTTNLKVTRPEDVAVAEAVAEAVARPWSS
jgi:2-C-methyl-D-erythritol 4-phosphate cytidylyltransferase